MDRAREAIFQILGPLDELKALDLYAGTGAMGLEALSRGARRVTFVESEPNAARAVRANLDRLGVTSETTVIEVPVEKARSRLARLAPFDLVLSDPPWPIAQASALLVSELVAGLVTADARLLLGHPADRPVELPEGSAWTLDDRRKWGGTGMSFYKLVNDPG